MISMDGLEAGFEGKLPTRIFAIKVLDVHQSCFFEESSIGCDRQVTNRNFEKSPIVGGHLTKLSNFRGT